MYISAGNELNSILCDDSRSFSSLSELVSDKTLNAIKEMGFTDMMDIQSQSIRPLLEGRYNSHL